MTSHPVEWDSQECDQICKVVTLDPKQNEYGMVFQKFYQTMEKEHRILEVGAAEMFEIKCSINIKYFFKRDLGNNFVV